MNCEIQCKHKTIKFSETKNVEEKFESRLEKKFLDMT